ncbi:hypothetical protein VYU27_002667 [Nannochloropsis oceanica]
MTWRRHRQAFFSLSILFLQLDSTQALSTAPRTPPLKQYFAPCSGGLSNILGQELLGRQIGVEKIDVQKRGCAFLATEEAAYRALLWSRTANGIWQLMVRQRGVQSRDDLYGMARRVEWPEAMSVDDSLAVQCVIGGGEISQDITHTHYSSLTIKNAVVDNFRERTGGKRPNVDAEDPVLPLVLFLQNDEAWLYRSLSGTSSLHKRGYRQQMHKSSLRETTAAALLLLAGYEPIDHILVDPMCGSGTIAIEAALIARQIAPGLLRLKRERDLSVLTPSRWPDTDQALLRKVVLEAIKKELPQAPLPIFANDWHPAAIELAKRDAGTAGVFHDLTFSNEDVMDLHLKLQAEDQTTNKIVICNPPWDLRLNGGAAESWEKLGRFLKREAGDGDAFLLSGNPDVTRKLCMKVTMKIPIDQAGMSLRLLHYHVLPPKPPRMDGEEEEDGGRESDRRGGGLNSAPPSPAQPAQKASSSLSSPPTRQSGPGANDCGTGFTTMMLAATAATPFPPSFPSSASPSSSLSSSHSISRKEAMMTVTSFTMLMMGAVLGAGAWQRPKQTAAVAVAGTPLHSFSIRNSYDSYAANYDDLDGGSAARWLGLEAARQELIGRAHGRVLECGVGTGLNFPFYKFQKDGNLVALDAIDLSPGMLREARAKAALLGLGEERVRFHEMDVANLVFADGSFDYVCDTFSLCVYPDPLKALKEMTRVCKPGVGRVLLLENSRSDLQILAAYQDATAHVVARIGGKSCVYNQDVPKLAQAAGLQVVRREKIAGGLFTMLECTRRL